MIAVTSEEGLLLSDTSGARTGDAVVQSLREWSDLPAAARRYVDRLGEVIGTEVSMVGVGPERTQSLVRPGSWLAARLER